MALTAVASRQRKMRLLQLNLDGTGTAALEGASKLEATLVDNGTGDYTVTFDKAFTQAPSVVGTTKTADSIVQVSAVSTTAFTIKGFDATDGTTAKDVDIQIIVVGSDAAGFYDS